MILSLYVLLIQVRHCHAKLAPPSTTVYTYYYNYRLGVRARVIKNAAMSSSFAALLIVLVLVLVCRTMKQVETWSQRGKC